MTVLFTQARSGNASAVLILRGDGPPARVVLAARLRNSPAHR